MRHVSKSASSPERDEGRRWPIKERILVIDRSASYRLEIDGISNRPAPSLVALGAMCSQWREELPRVTVPLRYSNAHGRIG